MSSGSVSTTSVRWSAVVSAIVSRWLVSRNEIASKSGVQARRSVSPIGFKPKYAAAAATNCGPVRPIASDRASTGRRAPACSSARRTSSSLSTLFRLAGAFIV